MKGFLSTLVAFATLAGSGCAHKELNPGRCNSNNDCPSGQTCDLSPQANGTCVCASPGCMDGGAGAGGSGGGTGGASGAGGMAGAGGTQDGSAGAGGCQPACAAPKGICANNTCVECVTSADCGTTTKPICDTSTNTCVSCTSDDQCVAKLGSDPGVCMAHQDGRCATGDETIYVANITGCNDSPPGTGTPANPFCTLQPVGSALSSSRAVVVIRGKVSGGSWTFSGQGGANLSLIGQQTATISPLGVAPAFAMSSGSAYLRDLKIALSASDGISLAAGTLSLEGVTIAGSQASGMGINATGGTVTLEKVGVDGCAGGGILLNGAAFDVSDTTVTGNGPSSDLSWGGIRIQNPPSGGPAQLSLITVQNNMAPGINCSTTVQATGVYATGNSTANIGPMCGFSSCGTPSATCGAQ